MPKEGSRALLGLAPEPGGESGPEIGAGFPVQLTALIGRRLEVAAALGMMRGPKVRLLTFTGPGGVGKTRLALRVAQDLVGEFEDGVYLVSLAPVRAPELVVPAIGRTLGITEVGERPLHERLGTYLKDKRVLLLLDNFEHVAPAATVVSQLLTTCPSLAVLATGRERLHLSGEHEYPVPPLTVPDRERLPAAEDLARYEAVALFVERARAAKPDFRLTGENAGAVAEICARLDGLPLAIELAAARVKLLPPRALLSRLRQGSGLLRGGGLDLPARQRTLRSTLQWSHDLLDEHEQRMLRRLSVFTGGCTLRAAEAVSDARGDLPAETLELVASLVDKNLLRPVEGMGGEPRLFMLETIREYALERLAESGEEENVREAHAASYLALAEEAEPKLTTAGQMPWLDLLEREHNNLRAALRWSLDMARTETVLRLVGALWRFWHVRGYLSEGTRWLEEALALHGGEPSLRARVLSGGGELAHSQGDLDRAEELREGALALSRQLGEEAQIAAALNGVAFVIRRRGEFARARAMHQEALELYRKMDDRWGVGRSMDLLGRAAAFEGDYEAALPQLEEGLRMRREVGDREGIAESMAVTGLAALGREDYGKARSLLQEARVIMEELGDPRGIAKTTVGLGDVDLNVGDQGAAQALYEEALTLLKDVGDKWWMAWCLEGMAEVAVARTRPERAARLFGAAESLRGAIGAPRPAGFRGYCERDLALARDSLDEAAFEGAREEGRIMTSERAVEYALEQQDTVAPPRSGAAGGLSPREAEVLRLVADGLTDGQVAQRLHISPRTVGQHLHSVYKKLGVPSRAAAVRRAVERDLF
ncbi:MAG TPA: tetratricopeptide repeat protein [Rubrobacter sp.]|nr:tetratricopeptide repeat protein [Rubrobacter sp.]